MVVKQHRFLWFNPKDVKSGNKADHIDYKLGNPLEKVIIIDDFFRKMRLTVLRR